MIRDAISTLVDGQDLTPAVMEAAFGQILRGEATAAQIAAYAVALRMKGETVDEIAAAARVMRSCCDSVDVPAGPDGVLLDTCGTGGDGVGTFNISTVAAIVVAACGVRVAKHGNRAVSSRAGSADVLEALGVRIDLPKAEVAACVEKVGVGFLFAPQHHGALRHAAPVRRELGLRTLFNLLGPLSNPAGASHQLVGIYDPKRLEQVARVLGMLGCRGAWVVHGAGGLDEISPAGPTQVAVLEHGQVSSRTLGPADFGLQESPIEALVGGDAQENAEIARAILAGEAGARRDAVVLNAAAALCLAGRAANPAAAAAAARAALDSGRANDVLLSLVEVSQGG